MFWSNFSQVCMFCNEDHSKLVPEYTQPGVFCSWTFVNNLMKTQKWTFTIKRKVWVLGEPLDPFCASVPPLSHEMQWVQGQHCHCWDLVPVIILLSLLQLYSWHQLGIPRLPPLSSEWVLPLSLVPYMYPTRAFI